MTATERPSDAAVAELRNIADARRFNREDFADDAEFADWAQSRARHCLRTLDAAPADPVVSADRFVVLKASGSRFAYVNDTQEGRTVKRYDILKGTGKRNGWEAAKAHAESLNAELAKEQSRGR